MKPLLTVINKWKNKKITQSFVHQRKTDTKDNWCNELQSNHTEIVENNSNLEIKIKLHIFPALKMNY